MVKRVSSSSRDAKRTRDIESILITEPLSADFCDAETLKALLKLMPQDARINFEYAKLFGNVGNVTRCFEKAISLEPDYAEYKFGFAQHLLAHGRKFGRSRARIKELMKDAIKLEPHDLKYSFAYAKLRFLEEEERTKVLKNILKVEPNNPKANYLLAKDMWFPSESRMKKKKRA